MDKYLKDHAELKDVYKKKQTKNVLRVVEPYISPHINIGPSRN